MLLHPRFDGAVYVITKNYDTVNMSKKLLSLNIIAIAFTRVASLIIILWIFDDSVTSVPHCIPRNRSSCPQNTETFYKIIHRIRIFGNASCLIESILLKILNKSI